MMYADEIMTARSRMGGGTPGEHRCLCCGELRSTTLPIKKCVSNNFTDFSALFLSPGDGICPGCASLLKDIAYRCKPVYWEPSGQVSHPADIDLLSILRSPPEQYILSLPQVRKKHHWLYAGISTPRIALIGNDTHTAVLRYDHYDVSAVIDAITSLVLLGIPKRCIITGDYSYLWEDTRNTIAPMVGIIAPALPDGAVSLIDYYVRIGAKKAKEALSDDDHDDINEPDITQQHLSLQHRK